eukprot:TRINITY_DN12010_c0_g1_i2.p1 TRINITY_DN12010_c0_g1~~TRINITY_DN12010_c0_g1_i2.p1  ORF type:complete len:320 (+),score=112.41 TRINITY_DN12010_c0_g1_i2:301-1260(+)
MRREGSAEAAQLAARVDAALEMGAAAATGLAASGALLSPRKRLVVRVEVEETAERDRAALHALRKLRRAAWQLKLLVLTQRMDAVLVECGRLRLVPCGPGGLSHRKQAVLASWGSVEEELLLLAAASRSDGEDGIADLFEQTLDQGAAAVAGLGAAVVGAAVGVVEAVQLAEARLRLLTQEEEEAAFAALLQSAPSEGWAAGLWSSLWQPWLLPDIASTLNGATPLTVAPVLCRPRPARVRSPRSAAAALPLPVSPRSVRGPPPAVDAEAMRTFLLVSGMTSSAPVWAMWSRGAVTPIDFPTVPRSRRGPLPAGVAADD